MIYEKIMKVVFNYKIKNNQNINTNYFTKLIINYIFITGLIYSTRIGNLFLNNEFTLNSVSPV